MKKAVTSIIVALVVGAIGTVGTVLWTFNKDVSALDQWKDGHEKLDNRQYTDILKRLDKLDEGQGKIIEHLIRR